MKIFLLIIMAICVTAIYDARKIGEKFFSLSDKNKSTKLIKAFGFIICVLSSIIYCFL